MVDYISYFSDVLPTIIVNKMGISKPRKTCPKGKTLNKKTGRCILKKKAAKPKKRECGRGRIYNQETGKCVSVNGKIGKLLKPRSEAVVSQPNRREDCLTERVYLRPMLTPEIPINGGDLLHLVEKWYSDKISRIVKMNEGMVSVDNMSFSDGYISLDISAPSIKYMQMFRDSIEDPDDEGNFPIRYEGDEYYVYGSIKMRECI